MTPKNTVLMYHRDALKREYGLTTVGEAITLYKELVNSRKDTAAKRSIQYIKFTADASALFRVLTGLYPLTENQLTVLCRIKYDHELVKDPKW
jgi:hypothetical protein